MNPNFIVPKLTHLPQTFSGENAVQLKLEQGIVIFRASESVQNRIEKLLEKQKTGSLSLDEERELIDYEEVDDYLSHINRLIRNSSDISEVNLAA